MKSEAKRILKLFWKITSFKSNTRVVILLAVSAVIYSCNFEKKNTGETTTSEKPERIVDYLFTCNLVDDAEVIKKYTFYHSNQGVWPEVTAASKASGAKAIKVYIQDTRLMLIISLPESLPFDEFNKRYGEHSPKMAEWDTIMSGFQIAPPGAAEGQTWVPMQKIYDFTSSD